MAIYKYIRASDLTDEDLEDETLEAWHTDRDGEQWFKRRRFPVIRGVPRKAADELQADDDEYEDDELEDVDDADFDIDSDLDDDDAD